MSSQYKQQSILIFKLSIQQNTLYSKNEDKRKNTLFNELIYTFSWKSVSSLSDEQLCWQQPHEGMQCMDVQL